MSVPNYIGFKAEDMGFDAHLTVLYVGDVDHAVANEIMDFLDKIPVKRGTVYRQRFDMFGPDNNIPVLRVDASEHMYNLRTLLEARFGSASQFREWNPHISLKFNSVETMHIPSVIRLVDLDLY